MIEKRITSKSWILAAALVPLTAAAWPLQPRTSRANDDLVPRSEPVDVTAKPTRAKVTVRWSVSDGNELVVVTGHEIERREGDTESWQKVGSAAADHRGWVDRDVRPRVLYSYRVVSLAELNRDHPRVRSLKVKVELSGDEKRRASEPVSCRTPWNFYLLPYGAGPRGGTYGPLTAYIKVARWDHELGRWRSSVSYFPVEVGQKIGRLLSDVGGCGPMDCRTGATLLDCGEEKKEKRKPGGGHESFRVTWILVRMPDGSEARFDSHSIPHELKGVR